MMRAILTLGLMAAGATTAPAQFSKIPDYDPKIHTYPPSRHGSCILKADRLYPFEHRAKGAAPLTLAEQDNVRRMKGDLNRSCNGFRRR